MSCSFFSSPDGEQDVSRPAQRAPAAVCNLWLREPENKSPRVPKGLGKRIKGLMRYMGGCRLEEMECVPAM